MPNLHKRNSLNLQRSVLGGCPDASGPRNHGEPAGRARIAGAVAAVIGNRMRPNAWTSSFRPPAGTVRRVANEPEAPILASSPLTSSNLRLTLACSRSTGDGTFRDVQELRQRKCRGQSGINVIPALFAARTSKVTVFSQPALEAALSIRQSAKSADPRLKTRSATEVPMRATAQRNPSSFAMRMVRP